ncbi:DEAD/DEAH box helicase [Psychrobacter sp. DM4]|uniref:DEAD/DEAH box helicase n=1 Tax=Psychrobacter sp. DM4 TaxID=3440637 RepID=UPI003F4FD682
MLPSSIAREIKSELENFLSSSFPMTTAGFQGHGEQGLMEQFLRDPNRPNNLLKGPWLEVKLPFRTASHSAESPLTEVKLGFAPYMHQQRAFERLATLQPQSTLVATGTGSGKTECFLYPILDYCLQERRKGIKAIIIYPMNALATDQARRFAKEVSSLTPKLTVGLFTGDGGSDSRVMSPDQVITNQDTLRDNPPDILLTNYKMLDFLLMRPKDQRLWKHNLKTQDLLRYLVVDELHTFDGAQGTDLACLIRRLRDKLHLRDNLACVGTSATIGGESARKQLAEYASEVFATSFGLDSIILEDRITVEEYVEQFRENSLLNAEQKPEIIVDWPKALEKELLPGALTQGVYLRRQANLWFSVDLALDVDDHDSHEYKAACVALGEYLHQHTAFLSLLRASNQIADLRQLAEQWQQDFNLSSTDYTLALLDSLTALVSTARIWADDSQQKVRPFLQVRVQLWLRELRRMLASVSPEPRLVHSDDLIDSTSPLHLPILHCRECHSAAWGAMLPQGEHTINPELQRFYAGWFSQSPDSVLLYPIADNEETLDQQQAREVFKLCTECCELNTVQHNQCQNCEQPLLKVWIPNLVKQVERAGQTKNIRTDDCPRCAASGSLMILGSRAASLASVAISQIYGSHCNDDHKLIAFSDSVQDAAHRAGFFGARTYMQTVRQALAHVARNEGDNMALSRFIDEVPKYWQREFNNDAGFIGTFIAPNMQWLSGYQDLIESKGAVVSKSLLELVAQRLRWEALTEFGLRSRIGRTLERSSVAVIQPDPDALEDCINQILRHWQEELEQFRYLKVEQVRTFLLGFLNRLRQQGAFYDPILDSYVREGGTTYLLSRIPWLPGFGFSSKPPAALTFTPVNNNFQNLVGRGSQWYQDWFNKTIAFDNILASAEYEQAARILINTLNHHDWLIEKDTIKGEGAWLLNTEYWQVVTSVATIACNCCGSRQTISLQHQANWNGMPCLQSDCKGSYVPVNSGQIGQLAYRTSPKRLVTSEHTGLLEGKDRLAIEQSFIYGENAWDVNLLSATPTLEMGIDIGDLSAVLLCSVPPAQANYLQRIGRAGRSNGNALALTIANGSNHDNYFYEDPLEMIQGDVATPGIFLNAMAVLERQLIAYCFDRWVATGVSEDAIAPTMGSVLNSLQGKGKNTSNGLAIQRFPNNLLSFIDEHQEQIYSRFIQLFKELDEEGQAHLKDFIGLQYSGNGQGRKSLSGEQAEHTPLSWRIVNRLKELLDSRESHRKRAADLKKNFEVLSKQPADDARDQTLGDLKRERDALLSLMGSINKQPTLSFFTDEGLLPNYAFPEEGVTLNSVIVRKVDQKDRTGSDKSSEKNSYEQVSLKFQRSAQAALNELVPENVFYVSEHKISIEQIDLRLSEPSEWRMCPSCHYTEDITLSGDKHSACPRCGDPYWADIQQKHNLLKLRQVYARANSRYDRISDDSDQREPKFFQRQLLIDIDPINCRNAMRIDNPELPFGFEYVSTATFREVNFGEQFGEFNSFSVAGKSSSRKGFQICKYCGMVRRKKLKKGQFAHALDCRLARPGAIESENDWFESLYLYRELKSEAIRILLPLADVAESEQARLSFIAAINLGLKEYFHGAVQHLEVTEMRESSLSGSKQYLVIYDRIPGGTGYLKQLMVSPTALFTMLEKALNHLSTCKCVNDENKDGCYSCILAYRNSHHRQDISRQAAVKLLTQILHNKDKLVPIDALNEVPTNHILESALEERFVQALGKQFKVIKERINNKPGYLIDTGSSMWQLEPQVEFGKDDGVLETRADFVLRPLKEAERTQDNELIIYTDGYEYHRDIVTDDLRKRLSLLRSGRKVWVLTWDDLDNESTTKTVSQPRLLLDCTKESSPGCRLWNTIAPRHSWRNLKEIRGLLEQGNFEWLKAWLTNSKQTWQELTESALCLSFLQLVPRRPQLDEFVANQIENNTNWYEAVVDSLPSDPSNWGVVADRDNHSNAWHLLSYIEKDHIESLKTDQPMLHIFMSINDAVFNSQHSKEVKETWRRIWQAYNVLQFAPRFHPVTESGLQVGLFTDLLGMGTEHQESIGSTTASYDVNRSALDKEWVDIRELSELTNDEIMSLQNLITVAPEVGIDLTNEEGATIGTAELAWFDRNIAVFIEPVDELPELKNWLLISLESDNWLEQLETALGAN